MLIAIEAERANNRIKTGVEHYAKQLILHLAVIDNKNNYILYLRSQPEEWLKKLPKNFTVKVMPFPIFWTQLRLSLEILLHPVDVLLVPASALPIIHPKNSVVTIHDVAWKYFPDSFTWFMRNFLNWSTGFAVKKAARIIAVSNATKQDLLKFYTTDEQKISVVHHGFELEASPIANLPSSIELPEKFVLFLSTLQPRKNLEGLIAAFKWLKTEHPELPHKLVVVGRPGWKFKNILKLLNDNKSIVSYLNHVSDSDRLIIFKKADLLVLPSFYEGFGMQLLESFAAGVPVATSNVSSLPEVAGSAAVYFEPAKPDEIKKAMQDILLDRSLHDSLVQKGRERLKNFSWEKCARETLSVLTQIKS